MRSDGATQLIDDRPDIRFGECDLSHLSTANALSAAGAEFIAWCAQAPDLANAYPFGAMLIELESGRQILGMYLDHLFADPTSMGILWEDLEQAYCGRRLDQRSRPFRDYATWEQETTPELIDKHADYWLSILRNVQFPQLQSRYVTRCHVDHSVCVVPFDVPAHVLNPLRVLCRRYATTLPIVLLGAFAETVAQWAHCNEILVCTPMTQRRQIEFERTVGFLSTNCPIRIARRCISAADSWEALTEQLLAAHEHAALAVEILLEFAPEKIGEVMFNFIPNERYASTTVGPFGLAPDFPHLIPTTKHFSDLMMVFMERDEGATGFLLHNRNLFASTAISELLDAFNAELSSAVARRD